MKNTLLLITILLLTACTPAPETSNIDMNMNMDMDTNDTKEMKNLKNALSKYTQATIDNDVDVLVGFIYSKAFSIVPKEKMLEMLKKAFKSGKVPKVKNIKHTKIEEIKEYDKGLYSIISSSMTTIVKSPRPNDPKFEQYMLKTLQKRLSSRGTVTIDKEKHLFNIQYTNKTMALNENGKWKFVGFKQAEKYISKGIFPLTLIEKLN